MDRCFVPLLSLSLFLLPCLLTYTLIYLMVKSYGSTARYRSLNAKGATHI